MEFMQCAPSLDMRRGKGWAAASHVPRAPLRRSTLPLNLLTSRRAHTEGFKGHGHIRDKRASTLITDGNAIKVTC